MMNCSFVSWITTALLSQIALKTNIQLCDMHRRLTVRGFVKDIAKKGDSWLTEPNLFYLEEQKKKKQGIEWTKNISFYEHMALA